MAARSATASAALTFCSTKTIATPPARDVAQGVEDEGDELRREAGGGLVEDENARAADERAGDRQHLALPARESPGRQPALAREVGEQGVEGRQPLPRGTRRIAAARSRFSSTVRLTKTFSVWGTKARP